MSQNLRRGRPPVGSDRTKSKSLLLRLSPAEKDGFSEAAALAGLPLAVWMRERLRTAARSELETANLAVPFIKPQMPE
jgi:hypothetical protein